MLHPSDPMPPFSDLAGVDGKRYSSQDFRNKIVVIVFSCNHCPYVQAYEERMIVLQRDYGSKDVQLIAINSNDTMNYPDDDFNGMVKRATMKGFNYPYLRDDDQSVATKYGATHTPQFFVFNNERKLCYIGKMDDNWQDPSAVRENYLRDALDALLSGKDVRIPETFSIGCTIKWR